MVRPAILAYMKDIWGHPEPGDTRVLVVPFAPHARLNVTQTASLDVNGNIVWLPDVSDFKTRNKLQTV